MTKANEHLDRAINAADHKVKELYDQKQKRRHARALIAYIIDYLAEDKPMSIPFAFGYGRALDDLREIAGIEPEKVYEHNDGN